MKFPQERARIVTSERDTFITTQHPVFEAVLSGTPESLREALESSDLPKDVTDPRDHMRLLDYAASHPNPEYSEVVLEWGAPRDNCIMTDAMRCGHEKTLKVLLKAGVTPRRGDVVELACLAAKYGSEKTLSILNSHNWPLDRLGKSGRKPIHAAIEMANIAAVKQLLSLGVSANSTTHGTETPLHVAIDRQVIPAISILMQHGANPNAKSNYGVTPHQLAKQRSLGLGGNPTSKEVLTTLEEEIKKREVRRIVSSQRYNKTNGHSKLTPSIEL
jgi:hypothetical protein